ncbi:SDR family NAD(P)-dependent oxidoreductase [Pseudomonas sp. N040]|uniref:SDR family NAD(P)-dependent oxidoreductase n=1 Tax=Pseudomonas sp. N040 TaxID=2785325 RepID=UPI0018A29E6F|nr:SDR family NAD(P)-dependent oxidoreductase [Pseudomonas sp. N040]MBF7729977.1 SDR family NAD(P)-dependent oxidoreductase [Pseudomonas sp. N040]MBW7013619.1 SDR family NAD(P)-dependent oxidoreductase [Pseudomonas sp. N040]
MNLTRLNPRLPKWSASKVWVIGASSGIGATVARHLLEAGAQVAISARRSEALQAMAGQYGNARAVPLDITDSKAFSAAWKKLRRSWGKVDLVLFVAGSYTPTRAWTLEAESINRTLDLNLGSIMRACGVLVPDLIRDGAGAIGLVSSVAAYGGMPNCITYGPTKAALSNFAEALYIDLHEKNLGVYLISPGFVRTEAVEEVNEFYMPALMEPDDAARAMLQGLQRGEFDIHFPKRFTSFLKGLHTLPYSVYFKAMLQLAKSLK